MVVVGGGGGWWWWWWVMVVGGGGGGGGGWVVVVVVVVGGGGGGGGEGGWVGGGRGGGEGHNLSLIKSNIHPQTVISPMYRKSYPRCTKSFSLYYMYYKSILCFPNSLPLPVSINSWKPPQLIFVKRHISSQRS